MNTFIRRAAGLLAVSLSAVAAGALAVGEPAPSPPLRALMLGGGPDLSHNQAAIESNVRYIDRLLPPDAEKRVLFFDGRAQSKDVLCEDSSGKQYYRSAASAPAGWAGHAACRQGRIPGAGLRPGVRPGADLRHRPRQPRRRDAGQQRLRLVERRRYLSVRTLASQIKTLSESTPVTLVMVECFSGSFGNLLFQNGDPNAPLIHRDLCGFFASISARPAAGCTPEINEADYRDFTGYFFAALSGRSRLGQPVTGADYNHDGKIGMDEAFAYTLIHDDSIDTPVCTSDVFLRRFVPDAGIQLCPYLRGLELESAGPRPPSRSALNAL